MKKSIVHLLREGEYESVVRYGTSGKAIAKELKEEGCEILKMETSTLEISPDEIKTIVDFANNLSEDAGAVVSNLLSNL